MRRYRARRPLELHLYVHLVGPDSPTAETPPPPVAPVSPRHLALRILYLVLPTVIVVGVMAALITIRRPTRVKISLMATRVTFAVGGTGASPILNEAGCQSITIDDFAQARLAPGSLSRFEAGDPKQYRFDEDRFPESAWKPVITRKGEAATIAAGDSNLHPTLTLQGSASRSGLIKLDGLRADAGSNVMLEVSGVQSDTSAEQKEKPLAASANEAKGNDTKDLSPSDINVGIRRSDSAVMAEQIVFRKPIEIITDNCRLSAVSRSPFPGSDVTYRAQPRRPASLDILSRPGVLGYTLALPVGGAASLFSNGQIPITKIELDREDAKRHGPESSLSLTVAGEITYPGYAKVVAFQGPDYLRLDKLDKFTIEEISPKKGGIFLRLSGIAGVITTGSSQFKTDQRLTLYDILWQDTRLAILIAAAGWAYATGHSLRLLWKELHDA